MLEINDVVSYCIVGCVGETTLTYCERSTLPTLHDQHLREATTERTPGNATENGLPGNMCRFGRACRATQHHGGRKEWQPAHHIPQLVRLCPAAAIPGTILCNLAPSSLRPLGRCSSSTCTLQETRQDCACQVDTCSQWQAFYPSWHTPCASTDFKFGGASVTSWTPRSDISLTGWQGSAHQIDISATLRVAIGLRAANKQPTLLMHMEYKERLTDHDFVIAPRHKLLPSVIASMTVKKNSRMAVTYSGPTYVGIRSANTWKPKSLLDLVTMTWLWIYKPRPEAPTHFWFVHCSIIDTNNLEIIIQRCRMLWERESDETDGFSWVYK